MRLVATADLHGHLPDIPECDLLIVAGDVCPEQRQLEWMEEKWISWLAKAPDAVWVAGNHDFVMQGAEANGQYLFDSEITLKGLRIYGTPWTPNLPGWAFQSEERSEEIFSAIPEGLDILVTHGPPAGYGDRVGYEHVGSGFLLGAIKEKKPKLVICGHIHPGYGLYFCGDTEIYNVAHMNDNYEPVHEPVVIDL